MKTRLSLSTDPNWNATSPAFAGLSLIRQGILTMRTTRPRNSQPNTPAEDEMDETYANLEHENNARERAAAMVGRSEPPNLDWHPAYQAEIYAAQQTKWYRFVSWPGVRRGDRTVIRNPFYCAYASSTVRAEQLKRTTASLLVWPLGIALFFAIALAIRFFG